MPRQAFLLLAILWLSVALCDAVDVSAPLLAMRDGAVFQTGAQLPVVLVPGWAFTAAGNRVIAMRTNATATPEMAPDFVSNPLPSAPTSLFDASSEHYAVVGAIAGSSLVFFSYSNINSSSSDGGVQVCGNLTVPGVTFDIASSLRVVEPLVIDSVVYVGSSNLSSSSSSPPPLPSRNESAVFAVQAWNGNIALTVPIINSTASNFVLRSFWLTATTNSSSNNNNNSNSSSSHTSDAFVVVPSADADSNLVTFIVIDCRAGAVVATNASLEVALPPGTTASMVNTNVIGTLFIVQTNFLAAFNMTDLDASFVANFSLNPFGCEAVSIVPVMSNGVFVAACGGAVYCFSEATPMGPMAVLQDIDFFPFIAMLHVDAAGHTDDNSLVSAASVVFVVGTDGGHFYAFDINATSAALPTLTFVTLYNHSVSSTSDSVLAGMSAYAPFSNKNNSNNTTGEESAPVDAVVVIAFTDEADRGYLRGVSTLSQSVVWQVQDNIIPVGAAAYDATAGRVVVAQSATTVIGDSSSGVVLLRAYDAATVAGSVHVELLSTLPTATVAMRTELDVLVVVTLSGIYKAYANGTVAHVGSFSSLVDWIIGAPVLVRNETMLCVVSNDVFLHCVDMLASVDYVSAVCGGGAFPSIDMIRGVTDDELVWCACGTSDAGMAVEIINVAPSTSTPPLRVGDGLGVGTVASFVDPATGTIIACTANGTLVRFNASVSAMAPGEASASVVWSAPPDSEVSFLSVVSSLAVVDDVVFVAGQQDAATVLYRFAASTGEPGVSVTIRKFYVEEDNSDEFVLLAGPCNMSTNVSSSMSQVELTVVVVFSGTTVAALDATSPNGTLFYRRQLALQPDESPLYGIGWNPVLFSDLSLVLFRTTLRLVGMNVFTGIAAWTQAYQSAVSSTAHTLGEPFAVGGTIFAATGSGVVAVSAQGDVAAAVSLISQPSTTTNMVTSFSVDGMVQSASDGYASFFIRFVWSDTTSVSSSLLPLSLVSSVADSRLDGEFTRWVTKTSSPTPLHSPSFNNTPTQQLRHTTSPALSPSPTPSPSVSRSPSKSRRSPTPSISLNFTTSPPRGQSRSFMTPSRSLKTLTVAMTDSRSKSSSAKVTATDTEMGSETPWILQRVTLTLTETLSENARSRSVSHLLSLSDTPQRKHRHTKTHTHARHRTVTNPIPTPPAPQSAASQASLAWVAAPVVGGVAAIVAVAVIAWCCCCRRPTPSHAPLDPMEENEMLSVLLGPGSPQSLALPSTQQQQQAKRADPLDDLLRRSAAPARADNDEKRSAQSDHNNNRANPLQRQFAGGGGGDESQSRPRLVLPSMEDSD